MKTKNRKKSTHAARNQTWLAAQLGIDQGRVSRHVASGLIPRKAIYSDADVNLARGKIAAARAANNATAVDADEDAGNAEIRALSKSPERVARIRLLIERTAKIKLERELLAGGYVKKEDVDHANVAKVYAVRQKLQELALRASLLVGKSETEIANFLTEWAKATCNFFAGSGTR